MDFNVTCLTLICCFLCLVPPTNSRRGHFDQIRKGNCTSCLKRLQISVAEELPRLSLIRKRILSALGRNVEDSSQVKPVDVSSSIDNAKTLSDIIPRPRTYGLNEIITVSQSANKQGDAIVIRFHIRKNSIDNNSEAVGASLLLFLDRKRKMRKGGRGKKVFIEISSKTNDEWKVLAFFRTRVKKKLWKSVSLPLNIAQRLLEPGINQIDLRVKCEGCGRLVDLVLDKQRAHTKKGKSRQKIKVRRRSSKKGTQSIRQKPNKRANPMLIISTRYKLV